MGFAMSMNDDIGKAVAYEIHLLITLLWHTSILKQNQYITMQMQGCFDILASKVDDYLHDVGLIYLFAVFCQVLPVIRRSKTNITQYTRIVLPD